MIINIDDYKYKYKNIKEKCEVRTIFKIKILDIKSLLEQVSLEAFLKPTNISFCLNMGRLFQTLGPTTLKALSAKVFFPVLGTISLSIIASDLRPSLFGINVIRRFCRYSGASPCRHLYTKTVILKSILLLTGNQCSL